MKTLFTFFVLIITSLTAFSNPVNNNGNKNLSEAKTQKLDSLYIYDNNYDLSAKKYYMYDKNGNILEESEYILDENNWYGENQVLYQYDENTNLISLIQNEWNFNNNTWRGLSKVEYTYDEKNNIISQIDYESYNNKWFNSSKTDHIYNEKSFLISKNNYTWADTGWNINVKSEYIYEDDLLIQEIKYGINYFNQLDTSNIISYKYSTSNTLIETIDKWIINQTINQFMLIKEQYTYDENNNLISTEKLNTKVIKPENEVEYYNDLKILYTYNENNILIEEMYLRWDSSTEKFYETSKMQINVDDSGNPKEITHYESFGLLGEDALIPFSKEIYNYDKNISIDNIYHNLDFDDIYLANKIIDGKLYSYIFDEEAWEQTLDYDLFYSDFVVSVAEISLSENFTVFPNPASEYVEISVNQPFEGGQHQIEIYDVLGNRVMSESIHPMFSKHRMNVAHLPKGVYFVRIGDRVEKFVKM